MDSIAVRPVLDAGGWAGGPQDCLG